MLFNVLAGATDMFGTNHIISLVLSFIVIVAGSILSIKFLKIETMQKILLGVGIVTEAMKVIIYTINSEPSLHGYLSKGDLPFHLCSVQIIFFFILVFSKNEKLKHTLHGFMIPTCLVGGFAALILARASSRSMPLIGIQYFSYHSSIVVFAIYLLSGKAGKFTVKDYRNTIIMLAAALFIALYLNSILYYREFDMTGYSKEVYKVANNVTKVDDELYKSWLDGLTDPIGKVGSNYGVLESDFWKLQNINFLYVNNPPQSGLPYLAKYPIGDSEGWIVYLIHYAFLAFVVVTLTYIKPIIDWFKQPKKAK